jgi:hypothetical protein
LTPKTSKLYKPINYLANEIYRNIAINISCAKWLLNEVTKVAILVIVCYFLMDLILVASSKKINKRKFIVKQTYFIKLKKEAKANSALVFCNKGFMSADNEMWQVLLSGDITDVDLGTLKQWIIEGKVLKTDKVRKGGGSWVDVARTPALRAALSSLSQQSTPSPAIQLQDNSANVGTEVQQPQYGQNQLYPPPDQPYLPPDQPYPPQTEVPNPDQPYLAQTQAPNPDQPYLDPNVNYSNLEAQAPKPAGTMFEGAAPPQKFLQADKLPEAFRKEASKKPKRISVEEYANRMQSQQSMGGLIAAGFLGGGIGVLAWMFFALATASKSYWICLGVGYIVGEMARRFGKCVESKFGIIAGFFAVVSSFVGQLIGVAIVDALNNNVSKAQVFSQLDFSKAYSNMMLGFGAFNILLYLGAGYIAYYFCFRTDTEMD